MSGEELVHGRRGTLGETLDGLPGVHMDNFGAGASRPVIRGQTLPRIEILSDGANVFDAASVSPDHAVVTDPLLLDAIEVQRGPPAIRYGGNAVNGAMNLIDSKVPKMLPDRGISGATEVRYGTADQEMTTAGRITAAMGPIALHAEGSYSDREDYDVPDSYGTDKLRDSFAESSSYALGASWVTDKGYIGAAYTRQDAEYGLPGHSHANGVCHLHGYPFPALGRIDLHVRPSASFGFAGAQKYLTENVGVFLSERRSFGPVYIEIAARKDWRTIKTPYRANSISISKKNIGATISTIMATTGTRKSSSSTGKRLSQAIPTGSIILSRSPSVRSGMSLRNISWRFRSRGPNARPMCANYSPMEAAWRPTAMRSVFSQQDL